MINLWGGGRVYFARSLRQYLPGGSVDYSSLVSTGAAPSLKEGEMKDGNNTILANLQGQGINASTKISETYCCKQCNIPVLEWLYNGNRVAYEPRCDCDYKARTTWLQRLWHKLTCCGW